MKKLVITGASVALAAMPVLGAFAATPTSFMDTLNVTVKGGCTIENTDVQANQGTYTNNDRTFTATIDAGTYQYLNTTAADNGTADASKKMTIVCNTSDSSKQWTVSATVTGLAGVAGGTAAGESIDGGVDISGNNSAWAIQSNATGVTEANDPFKTYAAAATNANFLKATANQSVQFNPSYRVYVSPNQASGAYTGTVVYSINLPA